MSANLENNSIPVKICSKCATEKPLTEYFVKDKTGRLHAQCKTCYKEHRKTYHALHYEKYGEAYRERAKIRRAKIKRELQVKLIEHMRNKACKDCGENDIRVLEFHHLDAKTKTFGIAKAISNGSDWDKILEEMQKCQILCANCHKKRTAKQFHWFKALDLD